MSVKELPEPVVQDVPLLVEYCQEALDSTPETLTVPTLVTPSELEEPLSVAREKEGAAGAVVSTLVLVQVVVAAELLPPAELVVTKVLNVRSDVAAVVVLGEKGTEFPVPLVSTGELLFPVPTGVLPPAVPCQARIVNPLLLKFGPNWVRLKLREIFH